MRFEDMRVLLTGATGGIGHQLAGDLVQRGAQLLIVGRDQRRLTAIARELDENGTRIECLEADLETSESVDTISQAAHAWGDNGINVLINAAGINDFGQFSAQQPERVKQSIQTNLLAPMLLTQRLWPLLLSQPESCVLNVGSILGSIGLPGQVTYSASKFGLHGFTEALRREAHGTSVRVLYVAPRATDTAMNDSDLRAFNAQTGTHMDSPADVAHKIVAALESRKAERFIGWPERLFVKLNALLPGVVDRAMRKPARLARQHTPNPDRLTVTNGVNS